MEERLSPTPNTTKKGGNLYPRGRLRVSGWIIIKRNIEGKGGFWLT